MSDLIAALIPDNFPVPDRSPLWRGICSLSLKYLSYFILIIKFHVCSSGSASCNWKNPALIWPWMGMQRAKFRETEEGGQRWDGKNRDRQRRKLQCPNPLGLDIFLQILLPITCIAGSKSHMFLHRCYFRLSLRQQGVDVARIFLFIWEHPVSQQSFAKQHYLHNNWADLIF